MKKVLATILTVIVLDYLLIFSVSAAGTGSLGVTSAGGKPGDTVALAVNLNSNPGLITMRFSVSYDSDLELIKVENSGLLNGWTIPSPEISSPYTIRWADSLATVNNTKAGEIVTLTFKIKDSATIGDKTVTLNFAESRDANGGKNTFEDVTGTIRVGSYNNVFTDISEGDWFYSAVAYVYTHRIMNGMTETTFETNKTTTRGMLVTMLHRLEGEPAAGVSDFTDVDPAQWYAASVAWAAEKSIVGGYGNGKFGPDDTVTREQVATILYRYAQYKGYNTSARADLASYADSDQVSDYAVEALTWANGAGIVNGKGDSMLDPLGKASRAEIATMFMRFANIS